MSTKDSLHIIMAKVAHFDLELQQMDVRTAFLNRDLVKDVYMSQAIVFEEISKENMVCKLHKSIYGLKQASRKCISSLMKLSPLFVLRRISSINAYI